MPPTTAPSDVDILAGLDFTPSPQQCECLRCLHHPGDRCEHAATTYTKVHALGVCKQPGLTADGGVVSLVCQPCMMRRANRVAELVQASHAAKARLGHFMHCASCARPITEAAAIWEAKQL